MAQVTSNVLFGINRLEIPAGSSVELINPNDNGLGSFEAIFVVNGHRVSGRISSRSLTFTPDEIDRFDLPLDANGLPLFKDLQVRYIGPNNNAVSTGDVLVVVDPWYNANQVECSHTTNARPNTDGRVGVQCNLIERF